MSRFLSCRTLLLACMLSCGNAWSADVTSNDWVMKLGVDFCGQAVGMDPGKLPELAAGIPGLSLENAGALTHLDAQFRAKLTSALRIDTPVKLKMGSLQRDAGNLNLVFIREDAQACYAVVAGTRAARDPFIERMTRVDSPWSPASSPDPKVSAWKRTAAGVDIFMLMRDATDSTEISVMTGKRAQAVVFTDLQNFATATARPCTAGALSGTRPGKAEFASFYESADNNPMADLYAKAPFDGIALMFPPAHSGCLVLVKSGGKYTALQVAKELGEAFAAIGGDGTTEVPMPRKKGAATQGWHFTEAATHKAARFTITSFGAEGILVELLPE